MKKTAAAFTLLEMLTVIAVAVILMSLSRPALSLFTSDFQVGYAGDKVVGFLNLARQTAIAKNHPVEVRFYQYADPSQPGEVKDNPNTGKYRAFQAFETLDDGTFRPISKVETLPNTIIINSNPNLSSLLASSQEKTWTAADPQIALAQAQQYNSRAFIFRPTGDAALSNSATWFVTLHKATAGDTDTAPPNFVTVQIAPLGGAISTHRP